MVAPLAVAKAYAAVQAQAANLAGSIPTNTAPGADVGGFADILKSAMNDTMQSSRMAETQMIKQVEGKADLIDVATAVQSAQASLQTVLAVRDQVIQAYQNVMAMQI
jgi:flagellar hook-basal body complex protein FliE